MSLFTLPLLYQSESFSCQGETPASLPKLYSSHLELVSTSVWGEGTLDAGRGRTNDQVRSHKLVKTFLFCLWADPKETSCPGYKSFKIFLLELRGKLDHLLSQSQVFQWVTLSYAGNSSDSSASRVYSQPQTSRAIPYSRAPCLWDKIYWSDSPYLLCVLFASP